jgi:DNA-binding response OmpR family regulator
MKRNNFGLGWLMGVARRWRSEPGEIAEVHTVLIVDDEESILRFVQRVLQEAGCRVFIAHDGAEALTVAATIDGLDLLVTDLMMPKMNGDELARRLRATEPDLPVLYLTGFSDRLFADRMQLWQSEAFLDKPCSVNGLLEAVSLVSHRAVPGVFGVQARVKPASAGAPGSGVVRVS